MPSNSRCAPLWDRMDDSESYDNVVNWLSGYGITDEDPSVACAKLLEQVFLDIINGSSASQTEKESEIDMALIDEIQQKIKSLPRPANVPVPAVATDDEQKYISELYLAYADAEGMSSFSDNDLSSFPDYRSDLFSKETEEISTPQKHSIFEDYGYDIIHGFEEKLREILRASKVGGAETARLNMENFDIEIGGLKKSVSMGGGFCGILNTITTLAMSSYLIELGRPAPGFYAVDSSLTQLSEAEHKEQSDTIKQNFIEYLIDHAHERQMILVEQTKRMPFIPSEDEERGVHVIRFTRNKQDGRYGLLNEVFNPEDQ